MKSGKPGAGDGEVQNAHYPWLFTGGRPETAIYSTTICLKVNVEAGSLRAYQRSDIFRS